MLARCMAEDGWPVLLLRGSGATFRDPGHAGVEVAEFTTNGDLLRKLEGITHPVAAVFHAAALCDFKVVRVEGSAAGKGKISSRSGGVTLTLEPAPKLLPGLRKIFPESRLVGWKYEVEGGRAEVMEKSHRQMEECRTDLCILNGPAWGSGFGVLGSEGIVAEPVTKPALCAWLTSWMR